ncbi:alpha/beta fold hydrolase [Streptomyces sp. NPDC001502]|uniref:alpha/beta fold hydrolase n=1 Tax=Streptomyces sp. NPDC001502 TaxID=3364578 RepID=UPI0036B2696A
MLPPQTGPLAHGAHTFTVDGLTLRYHVHGSGPVCVAHPGGPGIAWRYLRVPELEKRLTYESAPVTGPEFGAEMARNVEGFAARYADRPQVRAVMEAFAAIPAIADDEVMLAAAEAIVPAYVADYWSDTARWNRLQDGLRATCISGLDASGVPDLFDDRETLGALRVPALVVVGRHDVVCGMRWAEELHKLLHGSRLLVLEHSGHFGHAEEPESLAREVAAFVLADNG